ncbi:uncharacterized protein BDR25DRAFT_359489 [Lindgomyces ingoldianus]|uniref:Uncharacterized protein n=1 Tax=Lindgomyces ingoldianus TaxID=673940 RepID=A0ACB6QI01_9PLEO|nr:uncharacterized protein BDR25DRAFT_359489 [Lindgomyces ingoldianus]KAF2466593.1 hypothetical protein BDR25DRAFT_359489 [Lindgomyces ingoldianus]
MGHIAQLCEYGGPSAGLRRAGPIAIFDESPLPPSTHFTHRLEILMELTTQGRKKRHLLKHKTPSTYRIIYLLSAFLQNRMSLRRPIFILFTMFLLYFLTYLCLDAARALPNLRQRNSTLPETHPFFKTPNSEGASTQTIIFGVLSHSNTNERDIHFGPLLLLLKVLRFIGFNIYTLDVAFPSLCLSSVLKMSTLSLLQEKEALLLLLLLHRIQGRLSSSPMGSVLCGALRKGLVRTCTYLFSNVRGWALTFACKMYGATSSNIQFLASHLLPSGKKFKETNSSTVIVPCNVCSLNKDQRILVPIVLSKKCSHVHCGRDSGETPCVARQMRSTLTFSSWKAYIHNKYCYNSMKEAIISLVRVVAGKFMQGRHLMRDDSARRTSSSAGARNISKSGSELGAVLIISRRLFSQRMRLSVKTAQHSHRTISRYGPTQMTSIASGETQLYTTASPSSAESAFVPSSNTTSGRVPTTTWEAVVEDSCPAMLDGSIDLIMTGSWRLW